MAGTTPSVPPFVSVVVPCRNERQFIAACLESVINSAYPKERLEILVADGMSDDGTRDVIHAIAARDPRVKLLDNPKRILASAWNTGIRAAAGDIIVALNAHTVFPPEYIPVCVEHLLAYPSAGYVGGVVRTLPQQDSVLGRAIASALSHQFGVGGSRFRVGITEPTWSDTAAFGGYRRSVFEQLGGFNEELVRSQDMEFHLRLKKSGARILLVPGMVGTYYTRSTLREFVRFSYVNGFWLTYPLRYSHHMLSFRHLVPMVFVVVLAIAAVTSAWSVSGQRLALAAAGAYGLCAIGAALHVAVTRRSGWMLLLLPFTFLTLHVLYGVGSLVGLLQAAASRRFWRNFRESDAAASTASM
jgi:GT2 family glycosyltransferase